MSTGFADQTMTRREDVTVKVNKEVVRKAKVAAAYRGQSLAEFVSEVLESIVDRIIEEEYQKGQKGRSPKGGK